MLPAVIISGSVEGAAQFATVFLIFLVVLAATYVTTRIVGNYQKLQEKGGNFEAIETYRVTGNKYLQIVRVGEKYVVIGIGKDSITNICELSPDDIRPIPEDAGMQSS